MTMLSSFPPLQLTENPLFCFFFHGTLSINHVGKQILLWNVQKKEGKKKSSVNAERVIEKD